MEYLILIYGDERAYGRLPKPNSRPCIRIRQLHSDLIKPG
jgi:hypothetical protein